jgi:hypothetical protein
MFPSFGLHFLSGLSTFVQLAVTVASAVPALRDIEIDNPEGAEPLWIWLFHVHPLNMGVKPRDNNVPLFGGGAATQV